MVFNYNFSEHDNVDFFVNFLKAMSVRLHKIPQSYLVNEVAPTHAELPRVSVAGEDALLLQPPGEHGEDDREEHLPLDSAE